MVTGGATTDLVGAAGQDEESTQPVTGRSGVLRRLVAVVLVALLLAGVAAIGWAAADDLPTEAATGLWLATSPSGCEGASKAFDPATGQTLLFGDVNATPAGTWSRDVDSWSRNGVSWTSLTPAISSPTRGYATVAFDPATGQMLLLSVASVQSPFLATRSPHPSL
jgi:hypothetical protein